MALTPKQQALSAEEKQWADKLETQLDEQLASLGAAKRLVVTYDKWEFRSQPKALQHRVEFEVEERYRKAGWEAKWDNDGWGKRILRLDRPR